MNVSKESITEDIELYRKVNEQNVVLGKLKLQLKLHLEIITQHYQEITLTYAFSCELIVF